MIGHPPNRRFEWRLGRMLIIVTYVAVSLLLVGVALMLIGGISPLDGGPLLDIPRLIDDLAGLTPAGFLWLGLLAVIATPVSRVLGAAVGFVRGGEPLMALVAVAILVTIGTSIAIAVATG